MKTEYIFWAFVAVFIYKDVCVLMFMRNQFKWQKVQDHQIMFLFDKNIERLEREMKSLAKEGKIQQPNSHIQTGSFDPNDAH